MSEYKVEIITRKDGRYGWRLVHETGNIVATDGGQGYENRIDCVDVARNIGSAIWDIEEDS